MSDNDESARVTDPESMSIRLQASDGGPSSALLTQLAETRAQLAHAHDTLRRLEDEIATMREREGSLRVELQHRARNILAILRLVFRRTHERSASQDEFAEHFEGRLDAIVRYRAEIAGIGAQGMELGDMVREELFNVHCVEGPRCVIDGPPVRLHRDYVELMGLALHELTTNALKFGALRDAGVLAVRWSLRGPDARTLSFHWKETGVPLVSAAPRPRGFGQDMIEEMLPYQLGAVTSFGFAPGGFDCSIELTLPAITSERSEAGADPNKLSSLGPSTIESSTIDAEDDNIGCAHARHIASPGTESPR